jgi:hypothetical protein
MVAVGPFPQEVPGESKELTICRYSLPILTLQFD